MAVASSRSTQTAMEALQTEGVPAGGAPSAAAARAFLGNATVSVKEALALQRPWPEFADRQSLAFPSNLQGAFARMKKNVVYFRGNYAAVLLAGVLISLILHPLSILFVAMIAMMWIYVFMVRAEPVIIMNRTLTEQEKVFALGGVTLLFTFGLTLVGSVLLEALVIGSAVVAAHAAVKVPDDSVLDDGDASGFLSWLSSSPQPALGLGRV